MKQANPINITHIDHVVIRANNLDNMVAFYQDVLGCKLERGPGDGRLAQLRAGLSMIDLVDAKGPIGRHSGDVADHTAPNMDHVCFQIDPWNISAVQEQLQLHDVAFGEVGDRYGAGGLGPSIYLKDPEGNTVELKGIAK